MRFTLISLLFFISNIAYSEDLIIRTQDTGFYQISKEDLNKLGFKKSKIHQGEINLSSAQGEQPFFFSSGKTKLSNPENLIFFADRLKGEHTLQHAHDDFNGFKVSKQNKNKNYKNWTFDKKATENLPVCKKIITNDHYENNKLLIRVNTREYNEFPELWYWEKLSYMLKEGYSVPIDISRIKNLDNITFTTAFRGVNIDRNAKDMPHHEVQIKLNGTTFTTLNWNNKIQFNSEPIKIPKELLKSENNTITFLVNKRKNGKKTIIDISMLDYFDLAYEIKPDTINENDSLSSTEHCQYGLETNQFAYSKYDKKFGYKSVPLNQDSQVFIGNTNNLTEVQTNPLSQINTDLSKVDYLMITHPIFSESIKAFADFYREQGMNVAIIDTEQTYQNYSYGVRELYAIKDLIKDTHSKGNGKLKHVLLVGDSSWDWRDSGQNNKYGKWANRIMSNNRNFNNFPHQAKYTEEFINRDFVPTGQYHSSEGHSASDNWFVSIIDEEKQKNEDFIPDLAIGRFPVSTPEESDQMITKTINYYNKSKVGPWKSRILWITNSNKSFQRTSVKTSNKIGDFGVSASNIFPKEMDGDNFKIQQSLASSMDEGNLIVHFVGHGGKSIWQIGPPDLKKNRDLFTLDHISNLKNSNKLPFVMSMSCYSAPFDHPYADSIGEKFIREPDVGAVAVLASSWRNTPSSSFSRYILENIFNNPKNSIGQAILAAKRHYKGRTMLEMYNLLGDPALRLAIPTIEMKSALKDQIVDVNIDTNSFQGHAKIEILDINSNVLSSKEIPVSDTQFSFKHNDQYTDCFQGRIYAWDSNQNIDAMSSFSCEIAQDSLETSKP